MKVYRLTYWFSTMVLSSFLVLSVVMYFVNYEEIAINFERLGFPAGLVYPLAVAKLLAVAAIIALRRRAVAIWAYAGLAFDFTLALFAHIGAGDGMNGIVPPVMALILLFTSYFTRSVVGRNAVDPA